MVDLSRAAPVAVAVAATILAVQAAGPPARAADRSSTSAVPARSARSRPPSDLPLDHWAYPLLERLVARQVLTIDLSTRPLSRSAVARALRSRAAREAAAGPAALTEREAWALDRLAAEFGEGQVDAPVLSLEDDGAVVGLGVLLGTSVGHTGGGGAPRHTDDRSGGGCCEACEDVCAAVEIGYELWGGVGNALGFYSDATILFEGQEGPRTARLSNRARTWRGTAVTFDRAYFKLERPHVSVAVGRRDPAWGRSERGRLLISGAAPTFDSIAASLDVGPLGLHAFHALIEYEEIGTEGALGPGDRVFLGAHRLVYAGRAGSIGLNEVVVYSSAIPDPAHLNPLLPYYVSQFNEREYDNVLWSSDFTWRPARGLEVYGEFLVDDLQYDRDTDRPDKYALTLGQSYYSHAAGLDYEITAEYSHARRWTYTHARVEHRYDHDGRPIGFELGPDADRALVEVALRPSTAWTVRLGYEHSRRGEGTTTEVFGPGDDHDLAFPSGNVTTVRRLAAAVTFDNLAGLSWGLEAAYADRDRESDGSAQDDGWEVRLGAEFRI
jgi:hypothetical protein